ncbi:hypothetical protein B0J13DRAFT_645774 [Dactylonectria estremocensis]|uniref:Uncharacterized protein n=1 Tax=Dactylonectria estremocensis TaxID=1079267 RepID=A0A9P9IQR3_9HYPO|nr:hypothetical protein B0J13DRAFT_645774 [Dactylonectria estremocensis]
MVEWTAGYVAGLIAFAIVAAQLWFPTAITFLVSGHLDNRTTAATWTAAGRLLHGSYWPFLLQADSSKPHGVRKSVAWLALTVPLITFLVSVAGIVTPLGLYEEDELDTESTAASFGYVPDSSAFFQGTSPRTSVPFTRKCTYLGCDAPCPYSPGTLTYSRNNSGIFCNTEVDINTTVPQILHDIYTSGTKNHSTTISNFFDIEWRQGTTYYDRDINSGVPSAAGVFRFLESFSLDDDIRAVEGLVVDGRTGGIGFRNHTLPIGHTRGATWSEDLLFIQPDVQCVDLNVTIDFTASMSSGGTNGFAISEMVLTDRGGFVNINTTDPRDDRRSGINAPDLRTRAYQAAWMTNGLSMMFMNITDARNRTTGTEPFDRIDSKFNDTFDIRIPTSVVTNFQNLQFGFDFGAHVGLGITDDENTLYPNPWGINATAFDDAQDWCEGWQFNQTNKWEDLTTRINNTYVMCQLMQGVPRRVDDGPANIFDDSSKWSTPVYSCASSVKATIKTVTFFHNGTTDNLEGLVVKEVEEKKYRDESDMPTWGMENSAFTVDQFEPIWGLVDPAFEGFPNISTVQAPSLYLPKLNYHTLSYSIPWMNLPAAIVPVATYITMGVDSSSISWSGIDYTGQGSMSLWMRWKELSSSATSISKINQLLWTDIAASALVGSKGTLGSRNSESEDTPSINVQPTIHRVKYRWAFGIPAFIVALCLCLVFAVVVGSVLFGHASLSRLRQNLKQVSVGRVLTSIFHPESSDLAMEPLVWGKENALRQIDMSGKHPMPDRGNEQAPLPVVGK